MMSVKRWIRTAIQVIIFPEGEREANLQFRFIASHNISVGVMHFTLVAASVDYELVYLS